MNTFQVTGQTVDVTAFRKELVDPGCGAYVQFEGWVRDHNEGQRVLRLEYEVYAPLAIKEGQRIINEAIKRFGLNNAAAIHRSGILNLTDIAVIVGAASAHRAEAFAGCRYIIDEVKTRLPIWKKEHYASGAAEWVNCQRCAEPAHSHA
jgi:molybdopterin synthase catalytic subunit